MFYENNEGSLNITFRQKGKVITIKFNGSIHIKGDGESLTHVSREELDKSEISLLHCPVIRIGGKKKWQPSKLRRFLEENPTFQGAFYLAPGSGNWDLDDGDLIVTSREILEGKRVGSARPEVELTNHRWLHDGRYVADRCKVLHGKVIETLETEIELTPGCEELAEAIIDGSSRVFHTFYHDIRDMRYELERLEARRALLAGEDQRNIRELIKETILRKLESLGAEKYSDLPEDFTLTPPEVDPDLWANRETVGTVNIPGLGRRFPASIRIGWDDYLKVDLTPEEIRQVTSWPSQKVYPLVKGMSFPEMVIRNSKEFLDHPDPITRWDRLEEYLSSVWDEGDDNRKPQHIEVPDLRINDLPPKPQPEVYSRDLLTGEPRTVYPALIHEIYPVKGYIRDRGWRYKWFSTPEKAAEAEAEYAEEAASLVEGRRLWTELTSDPDFSLLQEKGEILVDWGGHFRRMGRSGNCDMWVVMPDGSLRFSDSISYRKRYMSEGNKEWKIVGPDELALTWGGLGCDLKVAKEPVDGSTPQQFKAKREIEKELGIAPERTWLETPPSQPAPAPTPQPKPKKEKDAAKVAFTFIGKRAFRCSCPTGGVVQLTKGEFKRSSASSPVKATCPACMGEGEVYKS